MHSTCYELNLVMLSKTRNQPKGIAELPELESSGDTELSAQHGVVVSSDFLHPHRVPAPSSGNSFSMCSPQATCLPALWGSRKEHGVTPDLPDHALGVSPGIFIFKIVMYIII